MTTATDRTAEAARAAVGGLGREQVHAVVAPVPRSRELGDRHQLDRRDAQVHQLREMGDDRLEGAGAGERSDVELVEDDVRELVAPERLVGPGERPRIDHHRRSVHALGLEARGGVRAIALAVQPVLVARAGGDARHRHLEGPVRLPGHGQRATALDEDLDRPALGRPDAKGDTVLAERGTETTACAV